MCHKKHTGLPQEFLKHAIPGYLVRGRPFPLRLSNWKMTTTNTIIAIQYKWIKIIPNFCQIGKKIYFFDVPQNFSNYFLCSMRRKMFKIAALTNWAGRTRVQFLSQPLILAKLPSLSRSFVIDRWRKCSVVRKTKFNKCEKISSIKQYSINITYYCNRLSTGRSPNYLSDQQRWKEC